MRGGRFQQKTSEDASLRNAEALFESRTVVEIREVEANTRKEIEEKKEELRQLVGASYRDLIESADSIADMKNSCQNVALNIQHMELGFASLKHSLAVQHPPAAPPHMDMEKKKREKLYGIGSRVKYVVDTPEKIWGCLDEHMYLEGAQRYFRARKVQTLLTESEAKGENLSHFPLLLHQWSLVETFRGQISQRSRDRLLEPGLDVLQYAVALAAVAVIDELSPSQIVSFFFETRRAWLRGHLRTAMAVCSRLRKNKMVDGTIKAQNLNDETNKGFQGAEEHTEDMKDNSEVSPPDIDTIAFILSKATNIMQLSLCQAGQLFLEVNGDPPLFFSTILNSPPGSQLFGGIPNPEDEVKLWKLHWEKLETRMNSLAGRFISETCTSWIHTCQTDLMVEGKKLLDLIESGKDLERMEGLIRSECDSRKALEGSMEWLESAFGKSIDSPWDYVTALLLKEPLNLWNILYESIFVERAKGIVISGLAKIKAENTVDDALASISSSWSSKSRGVDSLSFQILGLGSTDLMWYAGTHQAKKLDELSATIAGLSGRTQEEDSFGVSSSYLGPEVSQLKDGINMKLRTLLEDSVSFIQVQHNTARSEELAPYLQKHCCTWMANLINELLVKVLNFSDDSSQSVGWMEKTLFSLKNSLENRDKVGNSWRSCDFTESDTGDVSPSVEKALFLARVFIAFSQHSWALPLILHPSKLWNMDDASVKESSLPWLPSFHHRPIWLDVKEFSTEGKNTSKAGLSTDAWKEDDGKSEFTKLQLALKYASLVAHSIWVSWSVERLTSVLARSLVKDDDLASSAPLKGWEETALRQLNEGGDEIEVRLPLPAMPSPYVISFLFKSCQEIYRVGGHALEKTVLQLFASRLLEKVLLVYEDFITGLKGAKSRVSEKGLLQLLFDLRFLGDVLSGGQHPYPDSTIFSEEEPFLSSVLSSSNLARVKELLFQSSGFEQRRKKWLVSLQERLSDLLDPIDWATYEPPLWENEQQSYQRCAVIFGFLVQLKRLYRDTAQRPPLNTESSTLKVSTSIPRFTYLPISTPSLTKKTAHDENGAKLKSMISSQHASKMMLEDDSSFASLVGARPSLKSLINQVGSRFGEGTLKLGSMLTDSQVSRFKDRSAAAFSTFGEILPSQAAGLFSSLTAGATKSETYY